MAANTTFPAPAATTIKSSFIFPARPSQQQQEQQPQYSSHSTSIAPYTSHHSTACGPYSSRGTYSHAPQNSISNLSRKSSGSGSSGDPFAYDRASLRATLNPTRHTPRSSIASLNGIQGSSSTTTSPALSSSGAGDRNKELPPPPAVSPVKNHVGATTDSLDTPGANASPLPIPAEYVQALHDYSAAPTTGSANICLSFQAGDFIKVLNRDSSGWWDGEINGTRGWFPSNYVVSDTVPGITWKIRQCSNQVLCIWD